MYTDGTSRLLEGLLMTLLLTAVHGIFFRNVNKLCDSVTCGQSETCRVVKECNLCRPRAVCLPSVPAGIDDLCLDSAFLFTLLQGDLDSPNLLTAKTCTPGRLAFDRCARGSECVKDGSGGGVCCYGKHVCEEVLDELFQDTLTYNDRKYLLSRFRSVDVENAAAICEARGGYLVEITDSAENDALKAWLGGQDIGSQIGVLIGGSDSASEGNWVFQFTGRTLTFFDWEVSPSQPDNSGDCIHMIKRSGFQWDDISCDRLDIRFVCEIPR